MNTEKIIKKLHTPLSEKDIGELHVGDMVYLYGKIFCGRDAVLPKIVNLAEAESLNDQGIDLSGGVIFHTAVSPAGVGPTSSNKLEIESSMEPLSRFGEVRIHLGKGAISKKTVEALDNCHAAYAVIPPVTALLESKTIDRKVIAFPELGMEAFYEITADGFPAIIAAAHGESIYD